MNIIKIMPFLDKESQRELVMGILNGEINDIDLSKTYPFLDEELINLVYEKYINNECDININMLIPFLNENHLEELYNKVVSKEITDLTEENILPFLSKETIKKIFNEYLNKHNIKR